MKRWALLCGVMLLFAGVASAQDDSKVEVFGGYSYMRFNPGMGSSGLNFNGGSGSIAYNVTPMVGVVADFGGYHYSQSGGDVNVISYMFGPKVSTHAGPVRPFVQGLFGGAHASFSGGGGSENAFAMALGGGLDWDATPRIGVRLIQAEYLMTRFGFGGSGYTQNNARISAGVTFRF